MKITIENGIKIIFPSSCVGILQGRILNDTDNQEVGMMLDLVQREIAQTHTAESIRSVEGIQLGKRAYRTLGKDPNRYRLSAEALMRRIVKGQELYRINTAVDVLNYVSLQSGVTIGGFDRDRIIGDIQLGIGRIGEEFEAIGRGPLNVSDLPVYRDQEGVIGNPTSDCTRTRILPETRAILMLITGFYGADTVWPVLNSLKNQLQRFCSLNEDSIEVVE